MRKLILIAACFTLSSFTLLSKENVQKLEFDPIFVESLPAIELIEMEGITIKPSASFNNSIDLFEIIDDDSINRDEMNKMLDKIWPASSPRPSH